MTGAEYELFCKEKREAAMCGIEIDEFGIVADDKAQAEFIKLQEVEHDKAYAELRSAHRDHVLGGLRPEVLK